MSQRTTIIDKGITVDLSFKVTIKSFSNHDSFKEGQIEKAVEEFKENIKKELEYIIEGEHGQQEFLQTVDFVTYDVSPEKGI